MGCHMCKESSQASSSAINLSINSHEWSSYEEACKHDKDLQSFDADLQIRTSQVINAVAAGVEVQALSFDSFKGVIQCLLEVNQEVVNVILECKTDIWKDKEMFELVDEYFQNSLQTLDFCTALVKCLKRARDSQLHIVVALEDFDAETEMGGNRYSKTLEELKNFKAIGDPFTKEFSQLFQSVYGQQKLMYENLKLRNKKVDKKLNQIKVLRKIASMIFVATYAAVLICSVVVAAIAAPPVAAALLAASSVPVDSMGKWIDSLGRSYENALKGKKEVIDAMESGAYVALKDLENIRVCINRLQIDIESLFHSANFAIQRKAVEAAIKEIKKNLEVFMKNCESLGAQADTCSNNIQTARTEVLKKIITHSSN